MRLNLPILTASDSLKRKMVRLKGEYRDWSLMFGLRRPAGACHLIAGRERNVCNDRVPIHLRDKWPALQLPCSPDLPLLSRSGHCPKWFSRKKGNRIATCNQSVGWVL